MAESISCRVGLSADGKTVGVLPYKSLVEDAVYVAAVIGAADGMPGGNVKAADSTDLPSTFQIQFRVRVERFVRLSEVTDPNQLERVGPIREADVAAVTEALEIVETSPRGFASNVDRTLSEIVITFNENVLPTGSADALELTIQNVLGLDEYYGEQDATGHFLWDWLKTTDSRMALFTGQPEPFGTVEFSGATIRWVKGSGSPDFHFNTEVVVRVRSDSIVSPTGHVLAEDVYVAFTTEYWPLYVGVEHIRLKLGPVLADMFDDTIRRHIHSASIDACEQALLNFPLESPYPAVRRYVRAKTILDILDDLGLGPLLQGGGSKKLGDLQINLKAEDLSKIAGAYKTALGDLDAGLKELRAYRRQSVPIWVVRGSTDPTERSDWLMRTWQNVRFGESTNTKWHRQAKENRSFDHPPVSIIGYTDSGYVDGFVAPWWH